MKVMQLRKELDHLISKYGDGLDVVFQDSPTAEHPELCKHEHFFLIEEQKDGLTNKKMELVLRTWPY